MEWAQDRTIIGVIGALTAAVFFILRSDIKRTEKTLNENINKSEKTLNDNISASEKRHDDLRKAKLEPIREYEIQRIKNYNG